MLAFCYECMYADVFKNVCLNTDNNVCTYANKTLVSICMPVQVVLRDYADVLWSNFNSFCKKDFDKSGCDNSRLLDAKRHSRYPELFHTFIESDINGQSAVSPFYKPLDQPCQHAEAVFEPILRARATTNQTVLVVAIEQALRYPIQTAHRIGKYACMYVCITYAEDNLLKTLSLCMCVCMLNNA